MYIHKYLRCCAAQCVAVGVSVWVPRASKGGFCQMATEEVSPRCL